MKFFRFVTSRSGRAGRLLLAATLIGAVSGLASVGLLDLLKRGLDSVQEGPITNLAWPFAGLCVLVTVTRLASQYLLAGLGQQMVMDLRLDLSRQIIGAPLRKLEELGVNRLLATLTDDINSLTQAMVFIPVLVVNGTITFGCFAYLAWLDSTLFGLFAGLVVVGMVIYRVLAGLANRRFEAVREEQDVLFQHFRGLGDGVKELQLHRARRSAFLDFVAQTADSIRRLRITATVYFGTASAWGNLLLFVTLGLLFFGKPSFVTTTPETLVTYTMVLFYVMTPLQIFLDSMPTLARADVAASKVQKLGFSLAEDSVGELSLEPVRPEWERIEVVDLLHAYHREGEEHPFTLGPIDLVMEPGQVIFLVGGNGSGKTTLAKLLVGLYAPEQGEIVWDGQPVTETSRDDYRQLFSTVFDDFYLFERLLGLEGPGLDDAATRYLDELRLDHKVKVEDGQLSTVALSKGQRKRLALLTAYLEDRPLYLFDEWAADQDPIFKDLFYRQILPELKGRGKTVLVISHDDRYFHLGDRLFKMENGHLREQVEVPKAIPVG